MTRIRERAQRGVDRQLSVDPEFRCAVVAARKLHESLYNQ